MFCIRGQNNPAHQGRLRPDCMRNNLEDHASMGITRDAM